VSRKEEALRRLSNDQLLEVAASVSGPPISNGTSRSELIKIIKDGLSLQEIEEKSRPQRRETITALINRNELRLGAVGQVFLAASFALYGIFGMTLYSPVTYAFLQQSIAPYGIASSALLFVFTILLGFSMFKVAARLRGNVVGEAASLLGFAAALTGIVYYVSILLGTILVGEVYYSYTLSDLGLLLWIMFEVFLGSTLILLGAFFLAHHRQSVSSGLWQATGIVYMIAGSLVLSSVMNLLAPLFIVLAGFMGATCFLM
jgi:hypothetical protein